MKEGIHNNRGTVWSILIGAAVLLSGCGSNSGSLDITDTNNSPGQTSEVTPGTIQPVNGAIAQLGATPLTIDSNNSELLNPVLGGLLGTDLNIDLLGWEGLATVNTNLLNLLYDLNSEIGAGTVGELLESSISLETFYELTGSLLGWNGHLAEQKTITQLRGQLAGSGVEHAQLKLSNLLQLPEDLLELPINELANVEGITEADVNTLALVTSAAEIANYSLALPVDLPLDLPLINLAVKAQVITPPSIAVLQEGETLHAASTRVLIDLKVGLNELAELLNLQDLSEIVHLPIYLELGTGDVRVTSVSPESIEMNATSGLARAFIGEIDEGLFFATQTVGENDFDEVTIVNVADLITISAKAYAAGTSDVQEVTFHMDDFPQTQIVEAPLGSTVNNLLATLLGSLELKINLLGLELDLSGLKELTGALLAGLSRDVFPLLGEGLLNPLSGLLGVYPGKADITLLGFTK